MIRFVYLKDQIKMLKAIENHPQQFDISKTLQYICKKKSPGSKPQLDFLLLERELGLLKGIQLRTIQQIVEFVDIHLQDFVGINDEMNQISDKVGKTEVILQLLNAKLEGHRSCFYGMEGKIQSVIDRYQQGLLQKKINGVCMEETQFLIRFNRQIEAIMQKNVEQLTFSEKHLITRFCYKYQQIKTVLSHQMVRESSPEYLDIKDLLVNLENQLELYLGQQLKRVISNCSLQDPHGSLALPKDFQIWFTYLHKKPLFYEIVEEHLIARELSPSEKQLISSKLNILSGKNQGLVDAFFHNIFTFVNQLPQDYPQERIFKLIARFLEKKELNFLYTYMMPVFPIAYSAYIRNLSCLKSSLRDQLKKIHNWNIKRWAEFRAKSIMDRHQKDNDLIKWIDIIFKPNCMLEGVKTNMVRLCLELAHRHCQKSKSQELSIQNINLSVENIRKAPDLIAKHIQESFQESGELSGRIAKTVQAQLIETFRKRAIQKFSNLIKTCGNNLQNHTKIILKVLDKTEKGIEEDVSQSFVNRSEFIFKPLHGYLKSNPELSNQSSEQIVLIVTEELSYFYSNSYSEEIRIYCKSNVTNEQWIKIDEFMDKQRAFLFQSGQK